jgi:hypothetical protein
MYYAPRSLLSAAVYYLDLTNYVAFGTYQTQLFDIRNNRFATYTISAPVNSKGSVGGVELNWQAPIWGNFGAQANYTYADAKEKKSCAANDAGCLAATDDLVGASKNTYNVLGVLRGLEVRRAYRIHLPLRVLRRPGPQHAAVPGRYRDAVGIAQLHDQQELLRALRRAQPERPGAQDVLARTRTSRARSTPTDASTTSLLR